MCFVVRTYHFFVKRYQRRRFRPFRFSHACWGAMVTNRSATQTCVNTSLVHL